MLGNMNNNNFALLRYLRDLGAEADLLLMADDGVGPLAHFSPECDTWSLESWSPYIKRLEAPNRFISVIGNELPWSALFWAKHCLSAVSSKFRSPHTRPVDLGNLRRQLDGYDRYVGSGVAPALLHNLGIPLDLFYPYSSGIEWIADPDVLALQESGNGLKRLGALRVRYKQAEGIRSARHVVSSDLGYTAKAFEEVGVVPRTLQLPIVYREPSPFKLPTRVAEIIARLSEFDLRFISHARHRWVNTGDFESTTWESRYSKHNNWLITAYADFRKRNPKLKSVLVLSEYGTDVHHSKVLCAALGIEADVMWIPQLPRIEILEIISYCDVGIGEFYLTPRMIWGGAALEIMACGKPLIQGFIFDDGEYEQLFGTEPPPLLPVASERDVLSGIESLAFDTNRGRHIGEACRQWFDTHNGIGLAQRWLDLISA